MREEDEWEIYDRWLFLRKLLFSWFFTFQYSDINSEVKDKIAEKDPAMFATLESNVWKKLETLDLSSGIKQDIKRIQEESKEDIVLSFAKVWASFYEIYNNSLVYPDAYARILKNIIKKSEKSEFQQFLKYLDFDPHNQTDIERYLLVIHRLASSFRWNRSVRRYPVSVLSHTYIIAFFSYIVWHENNLPDEHITDMLLTALFHDIPEAITGDIITPTKKSVPGLEEMIEHIERDMIYEHLLSYLTGNTFQEAYAKKMLKPWDESHWALVKSADILSAYHEALLEAGFKDEDIDGSWVPYKPVGCSACNNGYKGRVGIYQVMPISEEIQRIILRDGSALEIAEQARNEGVRSLRESGLHKVKMGSTSLEEVLAVTNE